MTLEKGPSNSAEPDTFICHASEDKKSIAQPLEQALRQLEIYAWLDEFEISIGDSILQKINRGLATCRSATVILSRPFFTKNWAQYEMDGIVQRQMQGEIILFPIRHAITLEEIRKQSPSLAGVSSLNSSDQTIDQIASQIAAKLRITLPAIPTKPNAPALAGNAHTFGLFYVAPAETEELPPSAEPEPTQTQFSSVPTGWIRMVNQPEELEYILDGLTLRLRLDWGNHWVGTEMEAAQIVSRGEPFALTIRPTHGAQIYLPSVINQSQTGLFLDQIPRSGWMIFLIQ